MGFKGIMFLRVNFPSLWHWSHLLHMVWASLKSDGQQKPDCNTLMAIFWEAKWPPHALSWQWLWIPYCSSSKTHFLIFAKKCFLSCAFHSLGTSIVTKYLAMCAYQGATSTNMRDFSGKSSLMGKPWELCAIASLERWSATKFSTSFLSLIWRLTLRFLWKNEDWTFGSGNSFDA